MFTQTLRQFHNISVISFENSVIHCTMAQSWMAFNQPDCNQSACNCSTGDGRGCICYRAKQHQMQNDFGEASGFDTSSSFCTSRISRELVTNAKFMDNFDPENSSRAMKKRQIEQQLFAERVYDSLGRYRDTGVDACDCLEDRCEGCHFPCPKCGSPKCGTKCRVNRRYLFQSIMLDGGTKPLLNSNDQESDVERRNRCPD